MADYLVLTLDVTDLDVQTAFWCGALGYEHRETAGQYRALVDPTGKSPKMLLQRVDEAKSAKNRLHLDLHVVDPDAEAARLEGLGATRVGRVDQFGIFWITLLDPEGNELCVVPS
jgi:catechol 2,3-dioxygenase-like lactoylglutathione lyase family enzyme